MDDHPDRRPFLDKLLSFMEEKGTPITQCPTISKNPLDLFRLYLYTKERGGFIEVSYPKIIRILFQSKSKDPDHFFYLSNHSVTKIMHVKSPIEIFSAQSRKRGKTLRLNWALARPLAVPTL